MRLPQTLSEPGQLLVACCCEQGVHSRCLCAVLVLLLIVLLLSCVATKALFSALEEG